MYQLIFVGLLQILVKLLYLYQNDLLDLLIFFQMEDTMHESPQKADKGTNRQFARK